MIFYSTLSKIQVRVYSVNNKERNPFIDDSVVVDTDYCPRENIEAQITRTLNNGHKLALIGDRRVGKTSTAHYVINNMEGVYKVDIDFYSVSQRSDVAEYIINACKNVLDTVGGPGKIRDIFQKISPHLEIGDDGKPSFGVDFKDKEYQYTLDIAFKLLEEVLQRTKNRVVVLFDEFQAILQLSEADAILKYMRGKIQMASRIPFMYVGSIRHEMDRIFRNPDSPFFKQAEIIYFEHIEENIFFEFLRERFRIRNITFKQEVYAHLYRICYGITGDIQTFCRIAFESLPEKTTLNFEEFFLVMDTIYKNEQKYFRGFIEGRDLSRVQKNLLIQLAGIENFERVKLFGKEFQHTIEVQSPGAVRNALTALEKKGHIYQSGIQYRFNNPFFREWILDYKFTFRIPAGTSKSILPSSGTRVDFGYRERLMKERQS